MNRTFGDSSDPSREDSIDSACKAGSMYLEYGGAFERIRQIYFGKIIERLTLPAHARILDYGCGPGDFLLAAKSAGVTAVGVDSSARSVRLASERGLSVIHGNSGDLAHRADRFDAIVVQSVLEHATDGVALVSELRELLLPGGVLVLSAPTPGPFFWDDPTHVRPYTPKAFLSLAQIVQLQPEYIGYVFAFLLGIRISSPIIFQLMNIVPASLGSNLIAFMRKPTVLPADSLLSPGRSGQLN